MSAAVCHGTANGARHMMSKPNRHRRHVHKRKPPRRQKLTDVRPDKYVNASQERRCNKKKKYKTLEGAEESCKDLNMRLVFGAVPLNVYHCHKHNAWHLGHNPNIILSQEYPSTALRLP